MLWSGFSKQFDLHTFHFRVGIVHVIIILSLLQILFRFEDIIVLRIEQSGEDVRIWIKAVPGAARDEIAGVIGDRLKVRVSAAPEAGKANKSICKLIAKALNVKANQVSIESGQTNPEKIVRISHSDIVAVINQLP